MVKQQAQHSGNEAGRAIDHYIVSIDVHELTTVCSLSAPMCSRQDEEKVNWMVQQWLQERGYIRALKALQEVSCRHTRPFIILNLNIVVIDGYRAVQLHCVYSPFDKCRLYA